MALQATPDHPPHGTSVLKSPRHVHRRMESPITLCTRVILFPKRAQAIEKQAGGNELTLLENICQEEGKTEEKGREKGGKRERERRKKLVIMLQVTVMSIIANIH